jgi:hypothetical protein
MWPGVSAVIIQSVHRTLASLLLITTAAIVSGCAPEPTDPSESDLSGVWQSFDQDLHIRNIRMTLQQPSPGIVTGKWRADGRTDNACVPGAACGDSSIVTGRNEVAQVVLQLLGAGTFVGELATADTLKGIMRSDGKNFHVTFGR